MSSACRSPGRRVVFAPCLDRLPADTDAAAAGLTSRPGLGGSFCIQPIPGTRRVRGWLVTCQSLPFWTCADMTMTDTRRPTILVVDDNHDNAEIIRQYLEAHGYPIAV